MSLQDVELKSEYRTLHDDITKEFFIPLLSKAVCYKRSTGFFSSSALVEFSRGICKFVENGGKIKLITSPKLSSEDIEAMKEGYEERKRIIENAIFANFSEPKNAFEEERLNLLANLIANGNLDIKIAFTESGMYHEKLGIIEDSEENAVAFTGSMNETETGFVNNYEAFDVYCSWKEAERVQTKEAAFDAIWSGKDDKLKIEDFPKAKFVARYKTSVPKYDIDERENKEETENVVNDEVDKNVEREFFHFPQNIKPRLHQEKAIDNFVKNNYQSLFAMATGTGKTLTSLFAANELSLKEEITSILIIVPLKDLVDQWEKDVRKYFVGTIITIRSGIEWKEKFSDLALLKILKAGEQSERIVIITTYDSFALNDQKILSALDNHSLIIADEVHKFGAEIYSQKLPENIQYRIGLSATPKRSYDDKGTKAIFDYFCPNEKPYEFGIKEAIDADMLCRYNYYPTIIKLTYDEMDAYEELSEKVSKLIVAMKDKNVSKEEKERLEQLLKQRHRIIERAENKKDVFLAIMEVQLKKYKNKTIVFCPDGTDENGNDLLSMYKKELWQRLITKGKIVRMSEYVQGTKKKIIDDFSVGAIDILFAKQRLNEGIDIPSACRAVFIASSTSEMEFIQRRGRVLRKSLGKQIAEIFDFIVVPIDKNWQYAASVVGNEINRAMDFAATAENYAEIEETLRDWL